MALTQEEALELIDANEYAVRYLIDPAGLPYGVPLAYVRRDACIVQIHAPGYHRVVSAGCIGGYMHGVPGHGKRRRITEIKPANLINGHPRVNAGGQNVSPQYRPLFAD